MSAQAPHWKQSPENPSMSRDAGQLRLHALQPLIQFSLSLFTMETGITGIIANTAPMGQRNWQKNLGTMHMPMMMAPSTQAAAACPEREKLPDVKEANSSHGSAMLTFAYQPKKQRTSIAASTAYLTYLAPELLLQE